MLSHEDINTVNYNTILKNQGTLLLISSYFFPILFTTMKYHPSTWEALGWLFPLHNKDNPNTVFTKCYNDSLSSMGRVYRFGNKGVPIMVFYLSYTKYVMTWLFISLFTSHNTFSSQLLLNLFLSNFIIFLIVYREGRFFFFQSSCVNHAVETIFLQLTPQWSNCKPSDWTYI